MADPRAQPEHDEDIEVCCIYLRRSSSSGTALLFHSFHMLIYIRRVPPPANDSSMPLDTTTPISFRKSSTNARMQRLLLRCSIARRRSWGITYTMKLRVVGMVSSPMMHFPPSRLCFLFFLLFLFSKNSN
jgi:hypothetical protein